MLRADVLSMSEHPEPGLQPDWRALDAAVRRYVRAQVGAGAVVDDLVQDVLVRLHRHLGNLRSREKLPALVYRTARSVVVDHFRRQRPTSAISDDLPGPSVSPETLDPDPAQILSRWVANRADLLPERYREVLRRTELQGKTQRQVADELGLAYSTVKSRAQRGRALLHADLLACCRVEVDVRGRVTAFEPRPSGCGCAQPPGARCPPPQPSTDE
jgi:RNA polymerase sigma-70 factor, ECF subfamily